MRLKPPPEVEEAPGQFWKDFVRDTAPEFRKPTIEQLETFILPVWQALVDGARYVDERLREIFGELEPDVIVQDNVVGFPAVLASGRPWVRIVSCNPLELKDPALPPVVLRLPDRRPVRLGRVPRALPRAARAAAARVLGLLRGARRAAAAGARVRARVAVPEPLPLPRRGRLRALAAARPSAGTGSTRACALGRRARSSRRPGEGALVYVSLGSLGSADVELMNRLVAALAETPHRYVVTKGPQHELDRARAEHDRRRVPAAAGDPAAGRPRDHARRQQHGHRVRSTSASRWSCCRSSGTSTTTRSASTEVRLRRAAADLRVRGRRAARRDRPAARRGAAAALRGVGARCRRAPGRSGRPT